MKEMGETIFFSRHQQRVNPDTYSADRPDSNDPESSEYPGITHSGVEGGEETARTELKELVDNAEPNAVIFLGGSSEEERTKSTSKVYGNTLAEEYNGNDEVVVMTQDQMKELFSEESGPGSMRKKITELLDRHSDKKIVIDFPLFLKNLSLRPTFRDTNTGVRTEFSQALGERSGDNSKKSIDILLETQGDIGTHKAEKTPQEIAEGHVEDIDRLRAFAKQFTGDRQLVLGLTGHGWNLDFLAMYLANNGEVTPEAFKKFGEQDIKQGEIGKLILKDGEAVLGYKGSKYKVSDDLLEEYE